MNIETVQPAARPLTASPKPYKGMGMEGIVARWYAKTTANAMEDFRTEARNVAASLPPDASVLEVAPGPGYFSIELAKLGRFAITGLDISKTFVQLARENAAQAGVAVAFRQGNASQMPLGSEQFDLVFCRAAFKNFSQPGAALREMYRVLKPGGRALIIDLRKDASPEDIEQEVARMRLGFFSRWLTRLTFRFMLLRRADTKAAFENLLRQTQFRSVRIEDSRIAMNVWLEK